MSFNIKNMDYNTKLRLIDTRMELPSGSTLTLSGNTVFDVGSNGIPIYSEHPNFTGNTPYNNPQVLVDKQYVDNEFQGMVFSNDILVSIGGGKTFGRYENGDIIPSTGKTPKEVILLAIQEPINPTVTITLNTVNTNTDFGVSNKTINLNFSYIINSLGAISTSARLEWRRGSSGSWVTLTDVTTGVSGFTGTYLHVIDDTINRFNSTSAEFRLIVVDSQSATNLNNVTFVNDGGTNGGFRRMMQQNVVNSINGFQIIATNGLQSYETPNAIGNINGLRESGNINSSITYTVLSNNIFKQLTRVRLQRNDGGGWVTIRDDNNLAVVSHTVTAHVDTTATLGAMNIEYRIITNDQFITNDFIITSYVSSHGRQVNLRFVTYFGHVQVSNENILIRSNILALHDKRIFLSNPTSLTINNIISGLNGQIFDNTYYTYLVYPSSYGILTAVDILPALNINGAWLGNTTILNMNSFYGVSNNFRIYRSADPGGYNNVNVRWTW